MIAFYSLRYPEPVGDTLVQVWPSPAYPRGVGDSPRFSQCLETRLARKMRAGFGFTSPAQTWDEMASLTPPFQGITPAWIARDPKAKIPKDKVCAGVIEAI